MLTDRCDDDNDNDNNDDYDNIDNDEVEKQYIRNTMGYIRKL